MESEQMLQAVKEALDGSKVPFAYDNWPEGKNPGMPYGVYYEESTNPFYADGVAYYEAHRIVILLYLKRRSFLVERRLKKSLDAFAYTQEINRIDSEDCFEIQYEIEV